LFPGMQCRYVQPERVREGCLRQAEAVVHLGYLHHLYVPSAYCSENGPEFVSKALLSWIVAQGIDMALIEPGKSWQKGVAELQRQVPRRVSEPRMVSFAHRGEGSNRRMSATLQRGTSAFEPLLSHAERVRGPRSNSSAPAMQRAGTLRYIGPLRPGSLLNLPRGDKCSKQGKPSQANRGPKNLGRLVLTWAAQTRANRNCRRLRDSANRWPFLRQPIYKY
jgi:hypothetical protein